MNTLSSFCLKHSEKVLFNNIYSKFIINQFNQSDNYKFANFFHILYGNLKKIKTENNNHNKFFYLKNSDLFVEDLTDDSVLSFINFSYEDLFNFSYKSDLEDSDLYYILYKIITHYA